MVVETPIHRVIVGTAGHIDHGKSTLVRVLTGIDPDRLKEEKARGMTIDLGFAPYRTAVGQQVGIIDVPGHERFVKNMVAGASSVDIFLLVVAADDGVMPQTREHVEILDVLGARRGIVVITKIDLVENDLRELAIAEIAQFLENTPFADAPKLAVSSATGEGIPELKAELDRLIAATAPRASEGVFRMPIQRVFSAKGQGTVVTGVPVSGSLAIGDELEILPIDQRGRVRGIQAYMEERTSAAAGHSTAINVSDVDYREVVRGMVAATPGYFEAATRIEAKLRHLSSAERPLRHGTDVRLHIGTAEVLARVVLLEGTAAVEPGAETLVQFRLRDPVVAAPGDRYLIRLATPLITLGGGVVVASGSGRFQRSRDVTRTATAAKAEVLADRVAYFDRLLAERGSRPTALEEVPALLGLPKAAAEESLAELVKSERVVTVGRDKLLSGSIAKSVEDRLLASLKSFHQSNPLATHDDSLRLRTELRLDESVFDALTERLAKRGRIAVEKGGRLRLEGAGPRLSDEQRAHCERIRLAQEEADCAPLAPAELATKLGLPEKSILALLKLLSEQGVLWKAGDFHFARTAIDRAIDAVKSIANPTTLEVEVPKVRDRLGTTRKYLIPLLESLDARGFTVRRGDKRFLGPAARGRS